MADKLEAGCFYIIEPVVCPDIELDDWGNKRQPARYCGDNEFNLIGSEDPWPAKWVGGKIEIDI